MNFFICYKTIS